MKRTRVARAVRLLGAVAVTGVLSAGMLAPGSASAQTVVTNDAQSASFQANGLKPANANGLGGGSKAPSDANGLCRSFDANGL